MKLQVTRSGGFLGAPRSVELDTDQLPQETQNQVDSLLDAISKAPPPQQSSIPDTYSYDVQVEGPSTIRATNLQETDAAGQAAAKLMQIAEDPSLPQ